MISEIFSLLKSEAGAMHATKIAVHMANGVAMLENALKEGVTKNQAIDALISMLQAHKTPEPTAQPVIQPASQTPTETAQ